jgi:hypothetical protein
MYGFHPDTSHEFAVAETKELRRIAAGERRRSRRSPLKARHFLGTIFVR